MSAAGAWQFRQAVAADAAGLAALEARCFATDRISARSFRRLIDVASTELIVAMSGRLLVGYALVLFRATSRVARLYSIAVAPEAIGEGCGGALLTAAEDAACRRGCSALRLEVDERNRPARALYARSGYEQRGLVESYYQDGGHALRLEKNLTRKERG